jgi:hypothetical protein
MFNKKLTAGFYLEPFQSMKLLVVFLHTTAASPLIGANIVSSTFVFLIALFQRIYLNLEQFPNSLFTLRICLHHVKPKS